MAGSQYDVTWSVFDQQAGYSTSCLGWVGVGDGEQLPAGSDSTVSCSQPGCVPQPTSALPGALVASFTPALQRQPLYWTQYYLKITCDLTSPQAVTDYADYLVPSGAMRVPYALLDAAGTLITDESNPPFVEFVTPSFTLPGTLGPTVSFATVSRTVSIPESIAQSAVTMSDIFSVPESLPSVQTNVQYSEAIAFSVQISSIATRAMWRLMPVLCLVTVFSGSDLSSSIQNQGAGWTQSALSPSNKLDASFCGLNRPDMVALWAMVDDPSNATATEPDGLVDATNWALGAVPGDVSPSRSSSRKPGPTRRRRRSR